MGVEEECLCCEQGGWDSASGLVCLPGLVSMERQGFREPQKLADPCQSQHSPSHLGGARVGEGTGDQINGKVNVMRQQSDITRYNWRCTSQTLGIDEVEIPRGELYGVVPT